MAKQPTGGSSRGQARGGGTTQSRGSRGGAGGTQRGTERGTQTSSQNSSQSSSQNSSQNTAQTGSQNSSQQRDDRQVDQERQLNVSREGGGGSATSVRGDDVRGGDVRGGQRGNMTSSGQGQEQTSILPVLMSNPWLMTNAFLTNPFGFTQAMNQEMDRLFGNSDDTGSFGRIGQGSSGQQGQGRGLAANGGQRGRGQSRWAPQIEVRQRGNELTVCADLPGMTPDDIDVHVEDGMLTISGERQSNTEDNQEGMYRSERSYGAFTRTIPLPEGVSEDNVQARFEHGVLEVTVPLPQQQQQRGRRSQIQSGSARSNAQGGQNTQGGQSMPSGQGSQSGQSAQSGQGNQGNRGNQGREGRQSGGNAS